MAANALALALGAHDLGQFVGPVAAPAFTQALRRVSAELETRGLSPWRRNRVRTAWDFAAEAMRGRVAAGQAPRADLFEPQNGDHADDDSRTTAEELLEEVVRIAGDAADERKVPYLGRLYASLLFADGVSPSHMRFFCKAFETLTYRQLVALAVIAEARDAVALDGPDTPARPDTEGRFAGRFRSVRYPAEGEGHVSVLDLGVVRELDDLATRNLIGISTAKPGDERNYEALVNHPYTLWGDDDPDPIWQATRDKVRATPAGRELVDLAGLDELPDIEGETFLDEAWVAAPWDSP
jgi:hypothetical protein